MAVVQQSLQFPLSALFRITNAVGQSRNYAKYDASSPDADALLLVGEVDPVSAVVVEGARVARGLSEEVLHAAVGGEVGELARELGDLKKKFVHAHVISILFPGGGGNDFGLTLMENCLAATAAPFPGGIPKVKASSLQSSEESTYTDT